MSTGCFRTEGELVELRGLKGTSIHTGILGEWQPTDIPPTSSTETLGVQLILSRWESDPGTYFLSYRRGGWSSGRYWESTLSYREKKFGDLKTSDYRWSSWKNQYILRVTCKDLVLELSKPSTERIVGEHERNWYYESVHLPSKITGLYREDNLVLEELPFLMWCGVGSKSDVKDRITNRMYFESCLFKNNRV